MLQQPQSTDSQWFAFVVSSDARVIVHYNPDTDGRDIADPIGTDAFVLVPEGGWVTIEDVNLMSG